MKQLNTESTVVFQEREEGTAGDVVGSGHGMAVPYSTETMIGGVRESFAPESFDLDNVIGKPLAYRHGEPVGKITGAENREDGLYIDFDIVDTAQGRDAAVLARTGTIKGLSVGFNPIKSAMNRAKDAIQHTAVNLLEVSLTPYPAYSTAGIGDFREEEEEGETMSETMDTEAVVSVDSEAREALATLREEIKGIEARAFVAEETHELSKYRSLGEYSQAVLSGEQESRALVDQITTNNPGVMPPNWMQQVKNIVDLGRPGITAFGVESAGTSGLDFNWPYYDGDISTIVAAQGTEKTEVNSVRIDLKKGTASLITYGAGSDISFQLLQRSSPSYLDAHNRIMLNSYALVTDNVFVDAMLAGSTPQNYNFSTDTTGTPFREGVFTASVAVETATGNAAEFVLVASDVFTKIGGWTTFFPQTYGTQNVSGVATAGTLGVSVSGLPVIHDRNLAAGAILVSNRSAASWIEVSPALAAADNVSQLGRDVAVYGYGASALFNALGVVSLEVVAAGLKSAAK
jgi:HK97 family phage prohead protease